MAEINLGVDLSDVVARAAVIDAAGQVLGRAEAPVAGAAVADVVRDVARGALSGAKPKTKIAAAGVAMPSTFDALSSDVALALREVTSRDTEIVPVAAGNATALAEEWIGAARGFKQVVTFAIAEHVYAGVLINGAPWLGAHGFASSAGWLAMNPVEREDYRRLGGLEAEIASAGIVRRFVWRIKSGDESTVVDKVKGDFSKITAADIFDGSRSGDGVSVSVVRDTAKYVGMAIANLTTIFDPEIIVLGGVIAQASDLMLDPIKLECGRRVHPQQFDLVRIVLSILGHDAVAIGAARAAAGARA